MTKLAMAFVIAVGGVGVLQDCNGGGSTSGTFYPDTGALHYGNDYADTDFASFDLMWTNPVYDDAGFSDAPIYEHDFNVFEDNSDYDDTPKCSSCLSVSDLPNAYDDCPTAGVLDEGYMGFGFGSWSADEIEPNRYYYGTVFLYRNEGVYEGEIFDFNVTGARMYHQYCPVDDIWCLGSAETEILISQSSTDLIVGVADDRYW